MTSIAFVGTERDRLGESPLWDGAALWHVDSTAPCIHHLAPSTGERVTWTMPDLVGSIGLGPAPGTLVAALRDGLYAVDAAGGVKPLHRLTQAEGLRLNDGKMDRQGRFLCAAMHMDGATVHRGALHRFDPDGGHAVLEHGIGTGNALCFSPDGGTLYFADSRVGTIWAYPYDTVTGAAGPRRNLVDTAARHGSPPDRGTDGGGGFLWVAMVRSGQLARFAPDGRLDRTVDLPLPHPTCPAFGGPALDVLYVTSISDSGRLRSDHAESGRLLAVRGLGVRGLSEARFGASTPPTIIS